MSSQHHFDIEVAAKYGMDVATFLQNLSFWTAHNKANKKNYYEDRYWTYNTLEAFTEIFPYWSKSQIKRLIVKMINLGLIMKSKFNDNPYDHTPWYALTDLGLQVSPLPLGRNRPDEETKSSRLDGTKSSRLHRQIIKQDIKPNPNGKNELDGFNEWYNLYPRHEQRLNAEKAWKTNKLYEIKDLLLDKLNERVEKDYKFRAKKVIPLPATYLNGKFWTDEIAVDKLPETKDLNKQISKPNEPRCTVPEYGPGHPVWEDKQKWERRNGLLANGRQGIHQNAPKSIGTFMQDTENSLLPQCSMEPMRK